VLLLTLAIALFVAATLTIVLPRLRGEGTSSFARQQGTQTEQSAASGATNGASAASAEESSTATAATATQANPAANVPHTIACVGDSITYGYGVDDTRDTDAYPVLLQNKLAAGQECLNFGYSGACALSDGKNPYIATQEYYDAMSCEPNVVIVMLGTNDEASVDWDQATYEEQLGEIVDTYLSLDSSPQVVVMTPARIFADDWAGYISDETQEQARDGATNVASSRGLACVDVYALTLDHPEWFTDGVHPNKEGNEAIVQAVYDVLVGLYPA